MVFGTKQAVICPLLFQQPLLSNFPQITHVIMQRTEAIFSLILGYQFEPNKGQVC